MEATLYNKEGKAAGTIALPEQVFGAKWNNDLVHQVVVAMEANARTPIAHTKNRAEVSGTGKKPWRQKGTGSARHGSRRSPIWRTGGVAHGPRNERNYSQKINKKMRVKALYSVLSKKYADGEVLFLEDLAFETPKTALAKKTLAALASVAGFEKLATKKRNTAVLALGDASDAAVLSFRNFGNLTMEEVRNLNPVLLLRHKYLVIVNAASALEVLSAKEGTTKRAVSAQA